jgi:hypothetical protein
MRVSLAFSQGGKMTTIVPRRFQGLMFFVFLISCLSCAAEPQPNTFVITVSLPKPTIHVGDNLVVEAITSNPTDHVVHAGEGRGGGVGLEIWNSDGTDINAKVRGISKKSNDQDQPFTLAPTKKLMGPGTTDKFIWNFKPEAGSLGPGVYKIRVHRYDMKLRLRVLSNTVTLTVLT